MQRAFADISSILGVVWCTIICVQGMLELTPDIVASLGWSIWEPDGKTLLCIGHERGGSGLHRVAADGSGATKQLWWEQSAVAEGNWPRFSTAGGTAGGGGPLVLAIIKQSSTHPRDVWIADGHSAAAAGATSTTGAIHFRQATEMNPQSAQIQLPPVEIVEWNGADGWSMQGLYYPPAPSIEATSNGEQRPPATLMYVHGGPIGVQTDNYVAGSAGGPCSIALLQQAGYAIFSPNCKTLSVGTDSTIHRRVCTDRKSVV